MKVVVVYKSASEHARSVTEWLREFERRTGRHIDELDPETREGESFCRSYDIVEYPTLIALDDSGVVQNLWRGTMFPTISEVSYYTQ